MDQIVMDPELKILDAWSLKSEFRFHSPTLLFGVFRLTQDKA